MVVLFIARRILVSIPILLLVLVIIFSLVRAIPGDPAVALLGEGATDQQVAFLREQLDLDAPLPRQFVNYVSGVVSGDFGVSMRTRQPISHELRQRIPATLELSLFALLLAVSIGIPTGILTAAWANSPFDHAVRVISLIGVSSPIFWLALILQVAFSIYLDWLPVSGRLDPFFRPLPITGFLTVDSLIRGDWAVFRSAISHLILPSGVLAAFLAATIARLVRASMLEEVFEDYVRTARSKGAPERRVLYRHVLRNALLPTITVVGLKFAELLGGAVLTETVFSWPGVGRFMFDAIRTRDYPVIQAGTLFFAVVFILSSLIVDILYGVLNPRIREV